MSLGGHKVNSPDVHSWFAKLFFVVCSCDRIQIILMLLILIATERDILQILLNKNKFYVLGHLNNQLSSGSDILPSSSSKIS